MPPKTEDLTLSRIPDVKVNHLVYKAGKDRFIGDGGKNHWLSDELIEEAKAKTAYSTLPAHHKHNDCIRAAFEFLDAQEKLKSPKNHQWRWDVVIEGWSGIPISIPDIEVAAAIQPAMRGRYPNYNISTNLVLPQYERLQGIHSRPWDFKPREWHCPGIYMWYEADGEKYRYKRYQPRIPSRYRLVGSRGVKR